MASRSSHIRLVTPPGRKPAKGGETTAAWSLLVRRAQAGDVSAFEELIRAHQGAIYAFAVAQVRNTAEAADMTQDALIKAFRKLRTYRFEAPLRTWLLQITRNTCRDRLRQRQSVEEGKRRYAQLYDPDPPRDPEAQLRAHRDTERVHAALARVEPLFRETLILFDLQGLSYQEVAEVSGVPLGTVKSRLARGREALRKVLCEMNRVDGLRITAQGGEEKTP